MRFRKKPVVIDAIQFDGNIASAIDFSNKHIWSGNGTGSEVFIDGKEKVKKGDWIIKNDKGEISVCKSDIFNLTYEPVEEMPEEWTIGAHTPLVAHFNLPIEFQVDPDGLYCPGCGKPKILCLHDTSGCS